MKFQALSLTAHTFTISSLWFVVGQRNFFRAIQGQYFVATAVAKQLHSIIFMWLVWNGISSDCPVTVYPCVCKATAPWLWLCSWLNPFIFKIHFCQVCHCDCRMKNCRLRCLTWIGNATIVNSRLKLVIDSVIDLSTSNDEFYHL